MKKFALFFSFALVLSGSSFAKSSKIAYNKTITDEDKQFVQCLKDKGITMYGTSWCPHCKEQKHEFGELFDSLNYVDCDQDARLCREKKITGYPTWLLPDGKEIDPGSIKEVAESSGCVLSQDNSQANNTNQNTNQEQANNTNQAVNTQPASNNSEQGSNTKQNANYNQNTGNSTINYGSE